MGKEWKWEMDPPLEIVEQAVNAHKAMVKQMKGVPGVKADRLAEGMQPRHCALSLVGEPIMYPEINTLVGELHRYGRLVGRSPQYALLVTESRRERRE